MSALPTTGSVASSLLLSSSLSSGDAPSLLLVRIRPRMPKEHLAQAQARARARARAQAQAQALLPMPLSHSLSLLLLVVPFLHPVLTASATATATASSLAPTLYTPLPLGSVRPLGWVRSQLLAQSSSLCGKRWLGSGGRVDDSAWVGGAGYDRLEEAYPYWLNGALPLAVLLDDVDLLSYVRGGIAHVLDRQKQAGNDTAAGFLGPEGVGPWPTFRFCTALAMYVDFADGLADGANADADAESTDGTDANADADARASASASASASARPWKTESRRAAKAMLRHASALLGRLRSKPLVPGSWEHSRWQEVLSSYQSLLSSSSFRSSLAASPPPPSLSVRESEAMWPSDQRRITTQKKGKNAKSFDEHDEDDEGIVWDLMRLVAEQGFDWPRWFESDESRPFVRDSLEEIGAIIGRDLDDHDGVRRWFPNNTADADSIGSNRWMPSLDRQWTHGVNVAQAMHTWSSMYRLTSDQTWIGRGRAAWDRLMNLHGQSTGVFTGDETLAGRSPNRGSETCLVVELMNSAAIAFEVSGDATYLDRLERIAYNALPAPFYNGTMWSLNYYQQVNKIDAVGGAPDHCESGGCQYCYGMVYECCVSNHVQGWPKFAMRQLQLTAGDGGGRRLAITQYFPSETTRPIRLGPTDGGGGPITIEKLIIDTDYPFSDVVNINVRGASGPFVLELRIPGWCRGSKSPPTIAMDGRLPVPIDVAETGSLSVEQEAMMHALAVPTGNHDVVLVLPMDVRVRRRPPYLPSIDMVVDANAATIERGPLVYAMPVPYVRDGGTVYDDDVDDLPRDLPHGQYGYLLGTTTTTTTTGRGLGWRHALVVRDDSRPYLDLAYVSEPTNVTTTAAAAPPPPDGQGPFSLSLVRGKIAGRAVALTAKEWDVVRTGRGATTQCKAKTTSIEGYNASWADIPPRSPVQVGGDGRVAVPVELVPFGATDLRIAEFATTTLASVEGQE